MDEALDWRVGDANKGPPGDTSTESGVHETSFSVSPTDHSYDGLDNSSQGSTALAQDHSRGNHETSFSVSPTDHSYDGLDNSSQGSTALAQDHSRGNLNYTASPAHHLDYSLESLAEEYTDEPSIGWKRRRRSEEIL